MPINLDKPHLWNADTLASVDLYNKWFIESAPVAFRKTRTRVTEEVEMALKISKDLGNISPDLFKDNPAVIRVLRMGCCPPLAVDRLIGLSNASRNLLKSMEGGKIPKRMNQIELEEDIGKIITIVSKLLDHDIFVWLTKKRGPDKQERHRAATIVADRLTGADANPIIKNAQEQRQLATIEKYLINLGYRKQSHPTNRALQEMPTGTFCFHVGVPSTDPSSHKVSVSVDVVVQPRTLRRNRLPILIEAKSAGDYTNTNKRRKEESEKLHRLQNTFGENVCYVLFLNGYFDSGYLGYEAAAGIDWVWEHRIEDFSQLGIT